MRRVVGFLILAALVLAGAWWVAGLRGTVSVQVGDTAFDARAPAAILCVVVAFLVLYLLFRLIGTLLRLPRHSRRWRRERRRAHGDQAISRTLLALAAGDTGDARREAGRARRLLGPTPQTLMLVAEAGRLAGDEAEAEAAYHALTERPETAFLGYRGLLRQAMERKDWTEAADLARKAEAAHPGAAWLRAERRQLAVRTGAWSEALALADADAPKAALATAAAEAEADPARARRFARQAWTEAPESTAAALAYARRLREAGREGRAQSALRKSWAAAPAPALADFALDGTPPGAARVLAARKFVGDMSEHIESRLLMARVLLEAGQPAEAKQEAEAARLSGVRERRLFSLTADIDEAQGDAAGARDALREAATAAPDSGWRCEVCGTPASSWVAICPSCDSVGAVHWGAQRAHATLMLPARPQTAPEAVAATGGSNAGEPAGLDAA